MYHIYLYHRFNKNDYLTFCPKEELNDFLKDLHDFYTIITIEKTNVLVEDKTFFKKEN